MSKTTFARATLETATGTVAGLISVGLVTAFGFLTLGASLGNALTVAAAMIVAFAVFLLLGAPLIITISGLTSLGGRLLARCVRWSRDRVIAWRVSRRIAAIAHGKRGDVR